MRIAIGSDHLGLDLKAAIIEARFTKAWARADVTLSASRFGRPRAQAQTQ